MVQPPRPITNDEFQAMIPAHFLGGSRTNEEKGPVERGVRVTVERPSAAALLPPPPVAPGRVTETITKSTFTETTVTRVTDNELVAPLIIEVRPCTRDKYRLQITRLACDVYGEWNWE